MDNSSVFQSMLDKAIQNKPSDFVNFDKTKNVQDQLQEMVLPTLKERYNKTWDLEKMGRLSNWLESLFSLFLQNNTSVKSNSMEQLWLAFVMKECYNKIWSKEQEEWVSQSK